LSSAVVIDERAASRPAVSEQEDPVFEADDLGVLARHVIAGRSQIALALAADPEHDLVDDDDPGTKRVVHLESGGLLRGRGSHSLGPLQLDDRAEDDRSDVSRRGQASTRRSKKVSTSRRIMGVPRRERLQGAIINACLPLDHPGQADQ